MDKYMKFVLTIIAVGIIGINFQLLGGDIISKANAVSNEVHKIALCNKQGSKCVDIGTREHFGKDWNTLMIGNLGN